MTTTNDTEFAALAAEILNENGATATLYQLIATPIPSSGTVDTEPSITTVRIAPLEENDAYADGETTGAVTASTIIEAAILERPPVPGNCYLEFDARKWNVVAVTPVWSGDRVAVYKLGLRT